MRPLPPAGPTGQDLHAKSALATRTPSTVRQAFNQPRASSDHRAYPSTSRTRTGAQAPAPTPDAELETDMHAMTKDFRANRRSDDFTKRSIKRERLESLEESDGNERIFEASLRRGRNR
jgi:hypothetical protein